MSIKRHYISGWALVAVLLGLSHQGMAANEAQYHFLPHDTVIDNVRADLQQHGIDPATIRIDADAQGVVKLTGEVDSKQQAEVATRIAMKSAGVYAVLGALRYDGQSAALAQPVPASDQQVPAAVDTPVTDVDITQPNAW